MKKAAAEAAKANYGLGTFPAQWFFTFVMKGRVYESGGGGPLTKDAANFRRGCYGLVSLRLGAYPYNADDFYFTKMQDAVKKAKEIGQTARIFAIQYDGQKDWKETPEKGYESQIAMPPIHPEGNHATWHQVRPGFGFWEFSGPVGWVDYDFYGVNRWVWHKPNLPTGYQNTIFGVARVPSSVRWRPPLNGPISAPELKGK